MLVILKVGHVGKEFMSLIYAPPILAAVLQESPVTPSSNGTAINVTTIMPASNATTPAPVPPTASAVGQIWQGVAFLLQNGCIFLR